MTQKYTQSRVESCDRNAGAAAGVAVKRHTRYRIVVKRAYALAARRAHAAVRLPTDGLRLHAIGSDRVTPSRTCDLAHGALRRRGRHNVSVRLGAFSGGRLCPLTSSKRSPRRLPLWAGSTRLGHGPY